MSIDFYSNPIPYSGIYCRPYSAKVNRNGIKAMDSESKNSFIGSFLQPPDRMLPPAFVYIESKKLAAAAGDRPSLPNNQAVVAALKALQEKIYHLELEKSQAEDKLCSLSRAAARYKKVLEHKSYEKDTAHQELMQQRKDASVQLNAAQSRCSLLEKQLDYMRKMVSSAELEKKIILEQQAQLQKEEDQNWLELRAKLEKLEMLEKECLKLTATQRIAEDKIKHLEEKLCKEEHQLRLIQDKTAQLQTGFGINRILMSSVTSQHEPEKENGKNKKPRKVQKLKRKTQKLKQGETHVKLKCGEQKEAKEIAVSVKEKSWGENVILEQEKQGPGFTLGQELWEGLQLWVCQPGFHIQLKKFISVISPFVLYVLQNFRSIFCKQQTMRTFLIYDAEISHPESWGMLDAARTLEKRDYKIHYLKPNVRFGSLYPCLHQWDLVARVMDNKVTLEGIIREKGHLLM
ncbi:hypothetical protein DUI87_10663 [Hirundo rustica rustica]|uniref:Cep57 centrosome localisation domain-containing protein n=1 Tax=Hirundo rustica rustica TaxID=333673 RepID=A0A3M0KIR7_HIRRU|nr:hypothetical protein DUI87_10663 [Hirundo rustica rustica]